MLAINTRKLQVALLILFFLFYTSSYILEAEEQDEEIVPIAISSDQEFVKYAKAGNGTEQNPYLLTDYIIRGTAGGIYVTQTTKYFVIANCSFYDIKYEAIYINFIEKGTAKIVNNTIINAKFGINLLNAPGNIIENNFIVNCSYSAIRDSYSGTGSVITNNILYNNSEGVAIYTTNDTLISNNFIVLSSHFSLGLLWNCNNTEIHYNFILNAQKPSVENALSDGFNNNWSSNYWYDWGGSGAYFISQNQEDEVVDSNPLSFSDTDLDGIIDEIEIVFGLNFEVKDSDFDKINDYDELLIYTTSAISSDTDGDGISDYDELFVYKTNPLTIDTDLDGLSDYEEIFTYLTDPKNKDTDGDKYSDYEEVQGKTNPRRAFSNPNVKNYLSFGIPVFSGLIGVIFFSTRFYSNSKKNKIKVIFDTWNDFYSEWEKIIEEITTTRKDEVDEIIFEVKELKKKNIEELGHVQEVIKKAKELLLEHLKTNMKLSLEKYKKQSEIILNLQQNLIKQALHAVQKLTKDTILFSVRDYLWLRFIYIYSTSKKSEVIANIEDISGDSLFNKFLSFYKSVEYEEKITQEVDHIVQDIEFQLKESKKNQMDLIEHSINAILDSLLKRFDDLEKDTLILKSKIEDIDVEDMKIDKKVISISEIENLVEKKLRELK